MLRNIHRRINLINVVWKSAIHFKSKYPSVVKSCQKAYPYKSLKTKNNVDYSTSSKKTPDGENANENLEETQNSVSKKTENMKSSSDNTKYIMDKREDSTGNASLDKFKDVESNKTAGFGVLKDFDHEIELEWTPKIVLELITFMLFLICLYLVITLGSPTIEDGIEIEDEFTEMPILQQYALRTIHQLKFYIELFKEPSREHILPDIPHSISADYPQYTVVIEFTDVLVHAEWSYHTGWRFKKRPGFDHFLNSISGIFEIVVYTAEQGMIVFPVMEALDPGNKIDYKLVRDSTLFVDGKLIKDLNRLNRDLKKTIVIDWNKYTAKHYPDNVFMIPRWHGNEHDLTLVHLAEFLLAISRNKIDDIRDIVRFYSKFENPLRAYRTMQKRLIDIAEESDTENDGDGVDNDDKKDE